MEPVRASRGSHVGWSRDLPRVLASHQYQMTTRPRVLPEKVARRLSRSCPYYFRNLVSTHPSKSLYLT